MDRVEVEVILDMDDDGLSYIRTNPAIPFVLPSVEDNFEDDSSVSYPTGSKRKRDTVTTPAQKRPATEPAAPTETAAALEAAAPFLPSYQGPAHRNWSRNRTPIIEESLLTRVSTEEPEDLDALAIARPFGWARDIHGMAPLEPLELPNNSNGTNNSRVWESHRPSNLNFTIYEDPPDQETPNPSPRQEGFHPHEEDKENIFVSRSDFDSSGEEEEETHPDLAWNEASIGPRDAFGLPLNREMSEFVQPRDTPFPERPMRHGREVLRTIWVDETQVPEEDERWLHDGSLTDTQIREIEDIEASYQRGQLSRARSNRHQALRGDAPVQAPTNFHTDVRRVLHFQRHEGRSTTPEGSPVRPEDRLITPEEDENELQQEDQDQQDQDQ
ncbi:hypothetical protein N7517_010452 [Penicillium concentricum]|uniref:Uncharacterized protein n=1 Tax=Penicillium concentricum TaxID=293559 RepID=A0A9W9RE49_9EURO|nr:uncharacterized protein N7517_010452 [Penicillium concentricum]KAJ5355843.1 hypothetical protein N7517_010452 [Penicillium concentricum]